MAEIRPFAALRYAAVDDLGAVLAPPYDVISPEDQEALHAQDPHKVIRLELARGGTEEPLAGRYAHAPQTLPQWRRRNVLGRDPRPALYPYEEVFDGGVPSGPGERTRRGVFAAVRLHPWDDGVVLPHEHTRPKPKADRRELLHTCRTQFSPIFCLYDDADGQIGAALDEAMVERGANCAQVRSAVSGEIARSHMLWRTDGELADRIARLFADRHIYIADGHHRYETALEYRDERRHALNRVDPDAPHEFVMTLLVAADDPGLLVLPTHRMIGMDCPIDARELLASWRRWFDVEEAPLPPARELSAELARRGRERHVFAAVGVAPERVHWLTLRAPPATWDKPESWRDLDVGLLEALIVEPLARSCGSAEVEYTRDPADAIAKVRNGEQRLALMLNATSVQQVLAVARAGEKMPAKSTYFMPKVATGLVMYPLE